MPSNDPHNDSFRQALALDLVNDPSTKFYVGKFVVLDRGSVVGAGKRSTYVFAGELLTDDGCPISDEVRAACTSELWEVEVLIRPRRRFRELSATGRGTIEKLLPQYIAKDATPPSEVYDDKSGTWKSNDESDEEYATHV